MDFVFRFLTFSIAFVCVYTLLREDISIDLYAFLVVVFLIRAFFLIFFFEVNNVSYYFSLFSSCEIASKL